MWTGGRREILRKKIKKKGIQSLLEQPPCHFIHCYQEERVILGVIWHLQAGVGLLSYVHQTEPAKSRSQSLIEVRMSAM